MSVVMRRSPSSARRPSGELARGCLLVAGALALLAAPAHAQRRGPEFTRQGLLITNFVPGPGIDAEAGRRLADQLRDRLDDLLDDREVEVVDNGAIRRKLTLAGFNADDLPPFATVEQLGRHFRADELLLGAVERTPGGLRASAQLVLMRDRRMRQPLPPVVGPNPDGVARELARVVAAARVQLVHQRRCENFLREGKGAEAIRAAREGAAAYPRAALARTCLVQALRHTGASAPELLAAAREVLAIDSASAHALEAAGMALDSLRRRDEAADAWTRLAATDTANLELTERVVWALHENGNSKAAEPLIVKAVATHPDTLRLLQLQWRVANATRNWPLVIATGETMLARDSAAARDSGFVVRLASAYEENGQLYHAIATAARGVAAIPESGRLYALYARLVRGEADSVLPRGVARFPRSAELLAMNAEELRNRGRIEEALAATRQAVAIDPTLPQGELSIAQAEFDLGRPDSALAALYRVVSRAGAPTMPTTAAAPTAPVGGAAVEDGGPMPGSAPSFGGAPQASASIFGDGGEAARDSALALVARFALAKGNTLLRAADATKSGAGFRLALRYLALGDSLAPSPQSRFLVGTAALGAANAAMTEGMAAAGDGRCALLRESATLLPLARAALEGGRDAAAEAVGQYLGYLAQIETFVGAQLGAGCGGSPAAAPPA